VVDSFNQRDDDQCHLSLATNNHNHRSPAPLVVEQICSKFLRRFERPSSDLSGKNLAKKPRAGTALACRQPR